MNENFGELEAGVRKFALRGHIIAVEQLDTHRWRVSVDGRRIASFCSEVRARAAGKAEARRLEPATLESRGSR